MSVRQIAYVTAEDIDEFVYHCPMCDAEARDEPLSPQPRWEERHDDSGKPEECCVKGCEPPGEPVRSIVGSPRNWHPGDRASGAWDADFLVRLAALSLSPQIANIAKQQCPPHPAFDR